MLLVYIEVSLKQGVYSIDSLVWSTPNQAQYPEVGIYKRKQENTLSTKKAIKK